MKKIISTYWPVAILLPIALVFCMQAGERERAAGRHERHAQTSVAGVSAELARAISLGLFDDDSNASAAISKEKTL